MPMTDALDSEIWSLYAELMEAVPPPPALSEDFLTAVVTPARPSWKCDGGGVHHE